MFEVDQPFFTKFMVPEKSFDVIDDILHDLYQHFADEIFQSTNLGSSYINIAQRVTDIYQLLLILHIIILCKLSFRHIYIICI